MNIEYLGLGSDLKKILFEKFDQNKNVLYVFENSSSFFEIKREYLKNGENIFHNFKMMNLYDFYEKLFQTDKIVLKEEKQVVLFYNSLTDKVKKELKIKSYYDVIDIAYNFYGLFSELQEYKIDYEKIQIEKWQEKIFGTLLKINDEIKIKSDEKGLILPYMLRNTENISENFIKKYEKICFINKVKITPFEKELFDIIEKKGVEIVNILQLDKNQFDRVKLQIKDTFALPDMAIFKKKYDVNIELYEYENKFAQLLGVTQKLHNNLKNNREKEILCKIYDAQNESMDNEEDYFLLNQNKITYNFEITMKKTKIYKILNLIYNIFESVKVIPKKNGEKIFLFKMKEFYNAFKLREFLNVFKLEKCYRLLQELIASDYKYISREKLSELDNDSRENKGEYRNSKNETESFVKFLEKLECVYLYKTLTEYNKFLEEIFIESKEKEVKTRDKYFEALSEMMILEDLSFDNLWSGFFGQNVSAGLLKLFLKYLDKKAISLDLEKIDEQEEERKVTINNFSSISETSKESIMFLNLQDTFPEINVNNYLFSKTQRVKMGLPVSDDEKRIEIFKFYQNILSAKNIYLSYIKNIDENKDSAGVVEEIRLKYFLELSKNEISEKDELEFIKMYFTKEDGFWSKKEIGKFQKSKLEKNKEKLLSENLSLGFYDFEKLRDFEYGFYVEKMINEYELEKIEDKIDPLVFGNIIHLLYEKVVMENKEALENGNFIINDKKIENTLNDILASFEYKMPKEYMAFYKKISFQEIIKSAKKFLKELAEELSLKGNVKIYSEEKIKMKTEKEIYRNAYINGVVDLHIQTDNKEILVDYKSGKDSNENEKRTFNQLDYYSEMLPEKENNKIRKWIVNTWNGEITTDENRKPEEILTEKDIRQAVKEYYETEYCNLGNRKDSYFYRKYKDICRREEELDGQNE
ncbi:hypothetical protein EII29_02835 [Leptotrichia sp. OH3620_COT-345]|uniref:PD-(D/E)XK nuclease family protein n=1 Tax=Leptotrichia sp. OH3620_COT-345 TaxID=2491048 RepID=UPI000F6518FC|nr:PD-(D/E)XK nuclease family protein [Leptotrichia sp. OH3620_COT-345]RRD40430.1 hypothetical protein EII29_02835 [Leptotrichia sp. OH3620_COT-345]